MKAILIAKSAEFKKLLDYHFNPLGFEIIQYFDPLKAIEHTESEEQEMVIYHASDFPRHWKPFLKMLRDSNTKEEVVFILVTGVDFPFEEVAKAVHLGANGIVGENLANKRELTKLKELFKRYRAFNEKREFLRITPSSFDVFKMVFTNPRTNTIVTGKITDISIQGAAFKPNDPKQIRNLKPGYRLNNCSMQIGENIISLDCIIIRAGEELGLKYSTFDNNAHHRLFQYLMKRPERDLKNTILHQRQIKE